MTNPDAARWVRVTEIFAAVRELPALERAAALQQMTAADDVVAAEVAALLRAYVDDDFLEPVFGNRQQALPVAGTSMIDRLIGPYRIEREIGRGGMGVVYAARHADPQLDKHVAIKALAIGVDRPGVASRFRRERRILARLDHPNIATLYDGGTTDDGIPFLVMELVPGERIDTWCDRNRLTIPQRLDLFRQVCAAVQFAHIKLIVHRDIKPSNIFVSADGVVKLLDFGIAKLAQADEETDPELTELTHAGATPTGCRFPSSRVHRATVSLTHIRDNAGWRAQRRCVRRCRVISMRSC